MTQPSDPSSPLSKAGPGDEANSDDTISGARIELAPGVHIPTSACRTQVARSGGPGGQNVNKVNTKVELWLSVGRISGLTPAALARLRQAAGRRLTTNDELHLVAETHRSQLANRQEIHDRLRELILRAKVEPKRRRKTRPSAAARRRRLESKHHRAELKSRRRGGE